MIKILDSSYKRLAIIKNAENTQITKEINGEYTFSFDCILDAKTSLHVVEGNIIEIKEDYFDIVYYQKQQNDNGTLTMQVQCEHISYRLNNAEYDLDTFAGTGIVTQVLTALLSSTSFSIGDVELINTVTYSAQEKKSRRQLLMEFVAYIGAEVEFNKLTVNIKNHVGSTGKKLLAKGKNVKVVSKIYNAREKNQSGQPLVSYTVTPIQLPNMTLDLGDEVLLIQKELGIQEQLRIVKISYNPYSNIEASVELANFISSLEDQFYRIETQQVTKEKIYNGCKIGPDEGFVTERSDGKAKTVMNATDGISIYSDTGSGLIKNFYVDMNGKIKARQIDIDGSGTFSGSITGSTITGGIIKTAASGQRLEISNNGLLNYNSSNKKEGIAIEYFSGSSGVKIYHDDAAQMFIGISENVGGSSIGIISPLYTDLYIGEYYGQVGATVKAYGNWDFHNATLLNIGTWDGGSHSHSASTTSSGSHGHIAYTGTDGKHNHGIPSGAKIALVNESFNVIGYYSWVESGAHSHGVSVYANGDHLHSVSVGSGGSHSHSVKNI